MGKTSSESESKRRTLLMAKEQLPWELIEEILSRVSPESLFRFKVVSKRWKDLLDDKVFINNHRKTFRFILTTKFKIYSVSINPKIEVRELTLDILKSQEPNKLVDCNGLLLCGMCNGSAVVSNPWLRQTRWIEPEVNQPNLRFSGIGYDHNDNRYKTLSYFQTQSDPDNTIWKVHDFSSCHELKRVRSTQERECTTYAISCVSLDGALYSSAYQNTNAFFIHMFDFSTELCYKFCDLPCGRNSGQDALVLSVFRGDRFSLLKQCHLTKKIEVWVTKNKIDKLRGQDVEWMNVMDASVPNLPVLVETWSNSQPSYFIEDGRLVVCSCDETGRAWIYVVEDNKLISKVRIDLVVDPWPLHRTFLPSLVSVPRGQREGAEKLQL